MKRFLILTLILTSTAFGQTSKTGTLCTSEGAPITAEQLKKWTDELLPPGTTCLIVLTECYGGDTAAAFAGDPDTAVVSATSGGQVAYYGGYDDNAAGALKPGPGATGQTVHNAGTGGKHQNETPSTGGGKSPGSVSLENASAGGNVTGREVVVYAGKPDSGKGRDNDQRDTVKTNFAGEQNTKVTTVGGDGTNGWEKKGSADGLRGAIKDAGDRIRASGDPSKRQFILYVTDHGDLHKVQPTVTMIAPYQPPQIIAPMLESFRSWEISGPDLLHEPANITSFSFFVDLSTSGDLYDPHTGPFFDPMDWSMTVRTMPTGTVYQIDSFFDVWFELDGSGIVGDFPGEGVRVVFPVPEPFFVDSFFDVFLEVSVENHTPDPWEVWNPSQDSGDIGKPASCNPAAQDSDGDNDVDLTDFAEFQACFNGPNRPYKETATEWQTCACFDSDTDDGDVDLTDFAEFQTCFNGPNRPPKCLP